VDLAQQDLRVQVELKVQQVQQVVLVIEVLLTVLVSIQDLQLKALRGEVYLLQEVHMKYTMDILQFNKDKIFIKYKWLI
jgi:hypothetical protein